MAAAIFPEVQLRQALAECRSERRLWSSIGSINGHSDWRAGVTSLSPQAKACIYTADGIYAGLLEADAAGRLWSRVAPVVPWLARLSGTALAEAARMLGQQIAAVDEAETSGRGEREWPEDELDELRQSARAAGLL